MININTKTIKEVKINDSIISAIRMNNKIYYKKVLDNFLTMIGFPCIFKASGDNLKNYRIYGNSTQKGTPSNKNPISIESLGEFAKKIYIHTTGVNIFNKETTLDGYEIYVDDVVSSPTWFVSDFISVLENETYLVTSDMGSGILCYDENKNFIEKLSFSNRMITIPQGIKYVKINNLIENKNSLQLTLGTLKSYEKTEATIDFSKYEPLRKVEDVADYIDFEKQKIIRQIGKIESYKNEKINTSFISTTGGLDKGATIFYQLSKSIEESISLPDIKTLETMNVMSANDGKTNSSNIYVEYTKN